EWGGARRTPLGVRAGGGNVFTCLRAYVFTFGNDNVEVLSGMRGNSSSTFSILIAKAQGRKEDRHNVFNPALTPPTADCLLLPISEYKATDIPSDQRPDRMATPA